jgi:hypothetical protein
MNAQWTPYDFITNGDFADAPYLRSLVEEIRVATKARGTLLLVHQGDEFFQSLLYLSLDDGELAAQIQNELTTMRVHDEAKQTVAVLLASGRREITGWLPQETFAPIFQAMPSRQQTLLFPHLRARCNTPPELLVGAVAFDPDDAACGSRQTNELLDDLAVAVSASAPVYLRRLETRRTRRRHDLGLEHRAIERLFQQPPDEDGRKPAGQPVWMPAIQQFLTKVVQTVGAAQGGVFILNEPGKLFPAARVAWRPATRSLELFETPSPIELKRTRGGVVSRVFMRKQPYLFNDLRDFEQMNPNTGFLPVFPDPDVEINAGLAFPLFERRNRGSGTAPLGVLNVERSFGMSQPTADGARPFTLIDYLFIEEAAECLAEVLTRGLHHVLFDAITRVIRNLRPFSLLPVPGGGNGGGGDEDLEGDPGGIPADFAAARANLTALLARACPGVWAIAKCTVRVLSVTQGALVLVASYGVSRSEIDPEVPLQNPKLWHQSIARAVNRGEATRGQIGPPGNANEPIQTLSIPLFLESRCVGVVTFGSRFPLGLFSSDHAFHTIADAITAILSYAQTHALRPILLQAARVFGATHALSHIPWRAENNLDNLEQSLAAAAGPSTGLRVPVRELLRPIREDLDWLRQCLENYDAARDSAPPAANGPVIPSVRHLLDDVLDELKIRHRFKAPTIDPELNKVGDRIDGTVFAVCRDALQDLFNNAKREITSITGCSGEIHVSERLLGGRRFACVTIRNPMDGRLDNRLLPTLFRMPIVPPNDRMHYGAFLSAWLVRAIGGDVHLSHGAPLGDGHPTNAFSVTVEIPLEIKL